MSAKAHPNRALKKLCAIAELNWELERTPDGKVRIVSLQADGKHYPIGLVALRPKAMETALKIALAILIAAEY